MNWPARLWTLVGLATRSMLDYCLLLVDIAAPALADASSGALSLSVYYNIPYCFVYLVTQLKPRQAAKLCKVHAGCMHGASHGHTHRGLGHADWDMRACGRHWGVAHHAGTAHSPLTPNTQGWRRRHCRQGLHVHPHAQVLLLGRGLGPAGDPPHITRYGGAGRGATAEGRFDLI